MAMMKIRQQDGSWTEIPVVVGSDGRSAYEYAKDGGYTGTEAEFMAKLAIEVYSKSEADGKTATALDEAKKYTDEEIAELINGAPTTLDTLGEIATAMAENADVVRALNDAIGSKAAATDLTAHTGNRDNPHGVTAAQIGALPLGGGTMTGSLEFNGGDQPGSSKMVLATGKGQITNSGTQTLFGFLNDADLVTGHTSYNLKIRGKATRPSYNGGDLALKSDIPSVPALSTETWTFTLADGSTVTKAVYVG